MVDDLGEAEVGDLCGVLVGCEKDVFGLEVAVGDALRVDVLLELRVSVWYDSGDGRGGSVLVPEGEELGFVETGDCEDWCVDVCHCELEY